MKELIAKLKENWESRREAALLTIISSHGSTPRGAGARMAVFSDGSMLGTIGGGAIEYHAAEAAREAIREKYSCIREYSLSSSQAADIGMVCGGCVSVCIQYLSPEDSRVGEICAGLLRTMESEDESWLLIAMDNADKNWEMGLFSRQDGMVWWGQEPVAMTEEWLYDGAGIREFAGRMIYSEKLARSGTAYIFGGGHVAQKLAPLLAGTGFRCVVMDDREQFANRTLFPQADRIILGEFDRIGEYVDIRPTDYVCVMTRGHQYDYLVQKYALSRRPAYLGVMGSRAKVRTVTERLLRDGFTPEEISTCKMPIGLAIGAETPEEIAVSVAAEMIAVRACLNPGREPVSMSGTE